MLYTSCVDNIYSIVPQAEIICAAANTTYFELFRTLRILWPVPNNNLQTSRAGHEKKPSQLVKLLEPVAKGSRLKWSNF